MEYKKSSFLDEFEIPTITTDNIRNQLVKIGKSHSVSKRNSIDNLPIEERLKMITKEVLKVLGRYKGFVKVIRTEEELNKYIDKAIYVDYLSFDTETNNSLDPLTCKLMGLCLYTPNTKPVYVPMNHCKVGTEDRLPNQLDEEQVKKCLQRLKDKNTKMVYHNGKFDIRVCYNTLGLYLPIWWDTMIGAQLLDENELARLKYQYKEHVDPTISSYNIEKLFTGLPYAWIDIDIFAMYAAIDAYDTYKLQKYQQSIMEREDMKNLYRLFREVEMPIVSITSEMEDTGVCLDLEYLKKLDKKYRDGLEMASNKLTKILEPYENQIVSYQNIGKLDNPINYESTQQLSLVLYDVLKTKPIEEFGKSTEKQALKALKTPFTEALLEYRKYSILIKTFTNTLPDKVSKKDGKLHASFNQMGKEDNNVRTGRFSSTDPNLQQMPSHEKSMRLMFKASDGYAIVGGDFSAQEPRLLTHMCKDETLIDTFKNKRDPYATLAGPAFHKDYWDCMEHHQDGSANPEGKKWRSKGKVLMLGTMYGMRAKTMGKSLGIEPEECKQVLEDFYSKFPKIKNFTEENECKAKRDGYVEDYIGRRRHLPDAMLDDVEIRAKKHIITNCDVFIDSNKSDCEMDVKDYEAREYWKNMYIDNYKDGGYNSKNRFKELAKNSGIDVFDNGSYISKALTQCTNARIQGGAATLTKKAMIDIRNNKRLQELGFRILIPVHDELLGECPIENAEEVSKLMAQTMIDAAKPDISVDMSVDCYIVKHWYADEVSYAIKEEFDDLIKNGVEREVAYKTMCDKYIELSNDTVVEMCEDRFDMLKEEV